MAKNTKVKIQQATVGKTVAAMPNSSDLGYRRLFESARDGILILDAESGMIDDVNPFLIELLGYSHEQFLGKAIWEIGFFKDIVANKENYEELKEKEYIRYSDMPLETSDGRMIHVEFVSNVYLVNNQKVIQCNIRDVSERKRASDIVSLRMTLLEYSTGHSIEELLQKTLDEVGELIRSPIGFYHYIHEEKGTISLQAWSTRTGNEFCRAEGVDSLKSIDQNDVWADCVRERRPVVINDCPSLSNEKGMAEEYTRISRELVVPIFRKNQIVAILGIGNKPTNYTEEDVKSVSFLADVAWEIVEHKRAELALNRTEEQFRQSQKMEAVGRLAGGIAHDFNNMLTVINNYAEFVIAGLRPDDPLRLDVEEILKAGQRSAVLTHQLLTFSRKQVLTPEILDINKILYDIEPMLRRLIGEDIDLIVRPGDDLGNVKVDSGQIEQVMMNLVVNSRDAMSKGGKLTIDTKNVELDQEYADSHMEVTPGQYVMMSITDTGCGMDAQTIEHVFEPFYTTKEKGLGTGLGLSTVYGIVKQSGGHIWVYSEPGKGTTFKIYLPQEFSEAESKKRLRKKAILTTGTETIIVVEDEQGVRNLVKRVLIASGYTVHTAENGGEAFLMCERMGDSIQLMITDIIMPEMSGRELTDRLKNICPNMKVLYMSGYTENAIVHHGILDHGVNYISKPFSLSDLTSKVRDVLDG